MKLTTKISQRNNEKDYSPFGYKIDFYDGNQEIGTASVCGIKDNSPFLYDLKVFKDFRNKGYGTEIVKFMIDKYKISSLYVKKDNEVAIHLYKKFGFYIASEKDGMCEMKKDYNLKEDFSSLFESAINELSNKETAINEIEIKEIFLYEELDTDNIDDWDAVFNKSVPFSDVKYGETFKIFKDWIPFEKIRPRTLNNYEKRLLIPEYRLDFFLKNTNVVAHVSTGSDIILLQKKGSTGIDYFVSHDPNNCFSFSRRRVFIYK